MGLCTTLLVLVCLHHLLFQGRVQCKWNLSREEDLDIDKQLIMLNKPAIKTIMDKYGGIYDCVDFYKQPAFDHESLKNLTFQFQVESVSLYNKTRELKSSEDELCPLGSVPIRRITKDDLIRERQAYKDRLMDTTNRPGTYLAIARSRTIGSQGTYAGARGGISLHNPKVFGQQFSTTRIKLQSGPNSIEAGWRVDPTLYADNKTRLFVRTDVGKSHCFNTRCPGFVHTNREVPLDYPFTPMSVPGGTSQSVRFQIIRDIANGNWNFIMGKHNTYVGFWPSSIFTGLAHYVEWGGAAYSPPGSPLPQMGSGNFPIGSTAYDGFIERIGIVNETGEIIDPNDLETHADDSSLYSIRDVGSHSGHWGHVILYGGPGLKRN